MQGEAPKRGGADRGTIGARDELNLLLRTLRRDANIVARQPRELASHIHNMLFLDEGDAGGATLLKRARYALRDRPWLRLVNRPSVTRAPLLRVFEHGGTVWGVAWSARGDRLASAGSDGVVYLWDAVGGGMSARLDAAAGQANAVDWSPAGSVLAAGYDDGTLRLWDAEGMRQRERIHVSDDGVLALRWSPDGALVAGGTAGGMVVVREPFAASEPRLIGAHPEHVYALAWSPDGARLASADAGGVIRVWDREGGGPARELLDEELRASLAEALGDEGGRLQAGVLALAWSPDGRLLASGTRIGTLRLWDPIGGRLVGGIVGGAALGVAALAWSREGDLLARGCGEGRIYLAAPSQRQQILLPIGHDGGVRAVAWSPDGIVLASGGEDGRIRLWSGRELWDRAPTIGTPPEGHDGSVFAACWTGDGEWLASAGADQTVRLWETDSGRQRGIVRGLAAPALALAPASEGVLFGPTFAAKVDISRWESPDGSPEKAVQTTGPVFSLAQSPDGRLIASGDSTDTIWLREIETGEPAGVLLGPLGANEPQESPGPSPVWTLSWSPDGRWLASSSGRHTIVWDVTTRTPLHVLADHGAEANGRPRGDDFGFREGAEVVAVEHHALAWSATGDRLASEERNGRISVWNPATGERESLLEGHEGPVSAMACSPSGRFLASGGADRTVRLWDLTTGRCLAVAFSLSQVIAIWSGDDGLEIRAADDGTATGNRPIPYVLRLMNAELGECA